MPIGLICAIPQELTFLRSMLTGSHSEESRGKMTVAGATMGECEVGEIRLNAKTVKRFGQSQL
jgi:hypothetical protein